MADFNTLTSFSGADLIVNFGPKTIGELQQISWGIRREKAPVFTLGSPDARSFSRGKRGIGGSLVFAQFNRDALYEELVKDNNAWDQIAPAAMYSAAGNIQNRRDDFAQALSMSAWNAKSTDAKVQYGTVDGTKSGNSDMVSVPAGFGVIRQENITYADMIPPFDVTLTFANEYGNAAYQKIYDIDILDESSGVSVDSIVMERAMSYVARRVSPLMEGIYYRDSSGLLGATPLKSDNASSLGLTTGS